jgi:hypothetical protein
MKKIILAAGFAATLAPSFALGATDLAHSTAGRAPGASQQVAWGQQIWVGDKLYIWSSRGTAIIYGPVPVKTPPPANGGYNPNINPVGYNPYGNPYGGVNALGWLEDPTAFAFG